jgi:hypothetical protein
MSDKDREQITAALLEARGALMAIASGENLVGNIITRIDLALDRVAEQKRS